MASAIGHVRSFIGFFLFLALSVTASCTPQSEVVADLVLRGGKVVTVDGAVPDGEAIAVKGETIIAVGTDEEIDDYIGRSTEVIDLDGKLAIPGFIDSHGHFLGVGDAKMQLDLMNVANWGEVVGMVAAVAADAPAGELIRGRGWHQEKWDRTPENAVDGLPTHHSLSAMSPNNPVVLRHASGHASFANAKAMDMSGISRQTPDPRGGQIVRDANGEPIGVFRETASGLLGPATRDAVRPDPKRQAMLAAEEALSKGITTFHDAGSSFETIDMLKEMIDEGTLGLRMWVMIRTSNERLAEQLPDYKIIGYGNNHLTVRGIKRSIDGALGPHGAWLLAPYEDLPSSRGLNTSDVASVEETARLAMEHDFQLAVHAIGDRANREVLDIFERTFRANPDKTSLAHRAFATPASR
jgi:predicted amidohydrolase YtcJ